MSVVHLGTLADRVWRAYYCLDRDENGALPTKKQLEDSVGLSNGILGKLMKGVREDPRGETLRKVAQTLRCDLHWLMTGEGEAPKTSWPVPVRPQKSKDGGLGDLGLTKAAVEQIENQIASGVAAGAGRKRKKSN